jgi:hypothetical protein
MSQTPSFDIHGHHNAPSFAGRTGRQLTGTAFTKVAVPQGRKMKRGLQKPARDSF